MIPIQTLFKMMFDNNASDLHLRVGVQPAFRIYGKLVKTQLDIIKPDEMEKLVQTLMTADQHAVFMKNNELDFAVGVKGIGRFRINAYRQRGTVSLAIRSIQTQVPNFADLMLPQIILDIAMAPRGLILVTGTTGSGKSTLLASMVDHINENCSSNIITIEDR